MTEAVRNGNKKKKKKLAEQAKEEKAEKVKTEEVKDDLSSYGLTSIAPAKTYEKAQGVIPGLTMNEFASTYKKIDTDNNQSLKKAEVIAYMNKNKLSQSEGMKFWKAYAKTEGSSPWKIPSLKDGKWK